ncbi:MAG: RNA polymerase sigma factor [Cyclobacteriaceae bacterium]|nr:RNA polymerase sigma factor [Cyclobacteriaceae bacterium]
MSLKATAHIHADLIEQCRQGDRNAHYRLYKLYAKAMYNIGFRIVNSRAEAEDVLQESFISAFRNLHYYRGDASFGSWLKRIVVNKAITAIQKRKAERFPEQEDFDVSEPIEQEAREFPFSVEAVKEAIMKLPDGYRAVLSLYLLEGYDHAEIAEILGITESTSKSQFNRSKIKLREILEGGRYER